MRVGRIGAMGLLAAGLSAVLGHAQTRAPAAAPPATQLSLTSRSPVDTLRYYTRSADDSLAVRALYYLGARYWEDAPDSAAHFNALMAARARAAGRGFDLARSRRVDGIIAAQRGSQDEAVGHYLATLRLLDSVGRPDYGRHVHNSLAYSYYELGRPADARDSYRAALRAAGDGAPGFRAIVAMNLVNLLVELDDFDGAEGALDTLAELREHLPEVYRPNLALARGRVAVVRARDREAIAYLTEALDGMRGDGGNAGGLDAVIARLNLAGPLARTGALSAARGHVDTALAAARRIGSPAQVRNAYLQRARVDSLAGDFRGAYAAFQRYVTLRDSLADGELRARVAELEAAYETERSAREIADLELANASLATEAERDRGRLRWIGLAALLAAGLAGIYFVATRRARALAAEKDLLAREIAHRTRNQLNILLSLLRLEDEADGDGGREAVRATRRRIEAIAHVERRLARGGDGAHVEMADYLPDLLAAYTRQYPRLAADTDGLRACRLDVDRAVTVGLIVNELVTNTVKHAGTGEAPRRVALATFDADGRTTLLYRDDGGGYPAHHLGPGEPPDADRQGGLAILRGLTRQLGGDIRFRNEEGAVTEIDFPLVG